MTASPRSIVKLSDQSNIITSLMDREDPDLALHRRSCGCGSDEQLCTAAYDQPETESLDHQLPSLSLD